MLEEYDHNEKQWPRKKERKNAGCCSVSEFLLRSVLYFTAGILNAIGAGGMGSLNRRSRAISIEFILALCAFILMIAVTGVLTHNLAKASWSNATLTFTSSFLRRRTVSGYALFSIVLGMELFCKENDYSLDDCVHNLRRQEETLYRYILISGYGAWLATPTWLVLIIVLAVRCRRTTRANHHGSYDFDNPAQI
eukprot:gene640-3949_t